MSHVDATAVLLTNDDGNSSALAVSRRKEYQGEGAISQSRALLGNPARFHA
jgi:hypothetical protein